MMQHSLSTLIKLLEESLSFKKLGVRVLLIMYWLDPVSYLYQRLMKYNQVKT